MTAGTWRDSGRFIYAALVGSALVHATALLALSHLNLRLGDGVLPRRPRFIEVSLQEKPAVRVARHPPSRTVILPRASPAARVGPISATGGGYSTRPRGFSRAAGPPPGAANAQSARPGGTAPARQHFIPRPQPAGSNPPPAAAGGGSSGASSEPPSSGPPSSGGQVSLGTPSPGGDLPVPSGGKGPTGAVPGGASEGPGTGSGNGHGGSGEGTGPPGAGSGAGSGAGTGTGSGSGGGGGGAGSGEGGGGSRGRGGHVSRTADRSMPELVHRVNPRYPASAQADGVEGTVRLRVTVGTGGNVEQVVVAASSGDSRLDSAAVAAVRLWKYRPAVQNGEPRRVDTHATVTFRLD